eukprot:CAMPEP_0174294526 /NCGR_PEP_ID=MMETSP0809-20121228/41925_1 /TAXON_ID=73025 ORGANISM="Eutreptiella gymnastica-like, Strain CCMP1594" /NCGR_SAMPLE_ID=MMETSP0809 /ASSEMBLY_ACC=CAM_ASM_000658 /LENGTH=121 /DNA_ID=CAMNT_0015396055 /DNA_START=179 /DNA_END=545 /DNA_ORIENTATION=+
MSPGTSTPLYPTDLQSPSPPTNTLQSQPTNTRGQQDDSTQPHDAGHRFVLHGTQPAFMEHPAAPLVVGPDESGDPATRLTRRPTLVPLLETNSPSPPTSQYPGTAPMYLGNPGNLDFNDEK